MNKRQQNLFHLVKCALLNEKEPLELTKEECEELFEIAKAHQILALLFQGLHVCGVDRENFESFEKYLFVCIAHNQNQLVALEELKKEFSDADADYALLKGAHLKPLYPQPEFRMMGDLDILIRTEQYERVRACMQKRGYTEGDETDHEFRWARKPYISVELHKRLIPSYNYDYYAYYSQDWTFSA